MYPLLPPPPPHASVSVSSIFTICSPCQLASRHPLCQPPPHMLQGDRNLPSLITYQSHLSHAGCHHDPDHWKGGRRGRGWTCYCKVTLGEDKWLKWGTDKCCEQWVTTSWYTLHIHTHVNTNCCLLAFSQYVGLITVACIVSSMKIGHPQCIYSNHNTLKRRAINRVCVVAFWQNTFMWISQPKWEHFFTWGKDFLSTPLSKIVIIWAISTEIMSRWPRHSHFNCFMGVGNYNDIAVLWGIKRFRVAGKRSW